jgi:hypothetical protein
MMVAVTLTLDTDTRSVVALLEDAATTSGMSNRAFARALGTSASRFSTYLTGATRPSAYFCMRAVRIARSLAAADARNLMSAPATAAAVRMELAADRVEWAWRMLLQGRDHLRMMLANDDGELIGSWEAAPGSTGSVQFDALLAALAKHEFGDAGQTAPTWTDLDPLVEPWVPDHPFLDRERVIAKTPDWLRRLNIFVPERDLITA